MTSDDTITLPVADRWSYLWLVLGGILGLFVFGKWTIPLAPWLSILFFIHFLHAQKTLRGYSGCHERRDPDPLRHRAR